MRDTDVQVDVILEQPFNIVHRPTLSLHLTELPIHASLSPPRQTSRWPSDPQEMKPHTGRSITRDNPFLVNGDRLPQRCAGSSSEGA